MHRLKGIRFILVAAALAFPLTAAGISAAGPTQDVLHDCRPDGALDRSYTFRVLDRAYNWRRYSEDKKRNEPACDRALQFEIAAYQRPVRRVLQDCFRDGALDGRHTRRTLDLTLSLIDSDLREFSDCEAVIRSAAEELPRERPYAELAKGVRHPLTAATARSRALRAMRGHAPERPT